MFSITKLEQVRQLLVGLKCVVETLEVHGRRVWHVKEEALGCYPDRFGQSRAILPNVGFASKICRLGVLDINTVTLEIDSIGMNCCYKSSAMHSPYSPARYPQAAPELIP